MPMDIKTRRDRAIEAYTVVRPLYERFSTTVKSILQASMTRAFAIYSIEARGKTIESFADKACKLNNSGAAFKYADPMTEITDMAGVRVITFFPRTVDDVRRIIGEEFTVRESIDKSAELEAQEKFGYKSLHFIVGLAPTRAGLAEYKDFSGHLAEIQVRTILQHAWAEMEHDIQYKSLSGVPGQLRRRFMCLAGMLELADREFQDIQDMDAELRRELKSSLADELSAVDVVAAELVEAEDETEPTGSLKGDAVYVPGSTRVLLARGKYSEAVKAYDTLIAQGSATHTNFLGRAKARFLLGDADGALADLAQAAKIFSADPAIDRLRRQIEEGATRTPEEKERARKAAYMGNERLSAGDADGALEHYQQAEALGWKAAHSLFNRAISHCLAGRYDEMSRVLAARAFVPNTPYAVTAAALKCIGLLATSTEGCDHCVADLRTQALACEFSLSRSHLRYLEEGVRQKDLVLSDSMKPVFDALRGQGE